MKMDMLQLSGFSSHGETVAYDPKNVDIALLWIVVLAEAHALRIPIFPAAAGKTVPCACIV